jgi:hypothetical protein
MFDAFKFSLSLLADAVSDPAAPFTPLQLAQHLTDQAAHLANQAGELRRIAATMPDSLARDTMVDNATTLDGYARQTASEAAKVLAKQRLQLISGGAR